MNAKIYFTGLLFCTAGLFGQSAIADTLGLQVGGGIWQADPSGSFRYQGENINLKDDLHLQEENQAYTYALLEHPLPIIPNIKISHTALSSSGTGLLTKQFGGFTYSGNVNTKLVLDHSDITLYYQLLDNIVSFDLGITAKTFDGKIEVTEVGGTNSRSSNIKGTIPMLYAALGVTVPGTDLYVGMEGSALAVDNNTITDITTKVSYTTSYLLGFEAGLRTITIELDNLDGNYSNMEYSGTFANVFLHF